MSKRVTIAYTIGFGSALGGLVAAAIGLSDANSSYCGFDTSCDSTWLTLVILGSVLLGLGLDVAVAAYGRSKGRPFFPLLVASLFLGFPICLLALAVTTNIDARRENHHTVGEMQTTQMATVGTAA